MSSPGEPSTGPSTRNEATTLQNYFKRSFDEIDLDIDDHNELGGSRPSSSASGPTSDRHKRARSESRSEGDESGQGAGSSGSSEQDDLSATLLALSSAAGPSRISDTLPGRASTSNANEVSAAEHPTDDPRRQFDGSMDRFNAFEEQISAIRQDPAPSPAAPLSSDVALREAVVEHFLQSTLPEARIDTPISRSQSPRPFAVPLTSSASVSVTQGEPIVISDSDDDEQVVEESDYRHPQPDNNIYTRPPYILPQRYPGLYGLGTSNDAPPSASSESASARPTPYHPFSTLTSSQGSTSTSWSIDDRTLGWPYFDASWTVLSGTSTSHTPTPSARAPSPEPSRVFPLTSEERDLFAQRRADALRRVQQQRERMRTRTNSDSAIRILAERLRTNGAGSLSSSEAEDYRVYEGRGHHRMFHHDNRPTSPAAADRLPTPGHSAAEALNFVRRAVQAVRSSVLDQGPTRQEESEQRRQSLVMEGVLSENPDMLRYARSPVRRTVQPAEIPTASASASARTVSPRPSLAIQTTGPSDTVTISLGQSNAPATSRQPIYPSPSGSSQGQVVVRPGSPPSSANSSGTFVTANSSFDMSSATASRIPNAPYTSSPLRQIFPPSTGPSQATPSAPATSNGGNTDPIDLREVATRMRSLNEYLARVTSSADTPLPVRRMASKVMLNGQALINTIDQEQRNLSSPAPRPVREEPASRSVFDVDVDMEVSEPQPASTPVTRDSLMDETRSISERLRELSAETQRLREIAVHTSSPSSERRTRSPSLVSVSSTSSQRSLPLPRPFTTWHQAHGPIMGGSAAASVRRTTPALPPREESLFEDSRRLDEAGIQTEGHPSIGHRVAANDRWTQARQRRRELQNALLAEESRMRRVTLERNHPILIEPDTDDEVEELAIAEALNRQEDPIDLTGEENSSATDHLLSPIRPVAPPAALPRTGTSTRPQPRRVPVAPHQVINLDAYHDGPFRGALVRAVEASRRHQQRNDPPTAPSGSSANSGHSNRARDLQPPAAAPSTASTQSLTQRAESPRTRSVESTAARHRQMAEALQRRYDSESRTLSRLFSEWDNDTASISEMDEFLGRHQAGVHRQEARRSQDAASLPQPAPAPSQTPAPAGTAERGQTHGELASWRSLMNRRPIPAHSLFDRLTEPPSHVLPESPYRRTFRGFEALTGTGFYETIAAARRPQRSPVPDSVINSLPSGTYGEWATAGESEDSCPICFDDYAASDPVLKLPKCKHWFHRPCIEKWFKTAATCPICRERVDTGSPGTGPILNHSRYPRMSTGGRPPPAPASGAAANPAGQRLPSARPTVAATNPPVTRSSLFGRPLNTRNVSPAESSRAAVVPPPRRSSRFERHHPGHESAFMEDDYDLFWGDLMDGEDSSIHRRARPTSSAPGPTFASANPSQHPQQPQNRAQGDRNGSANNTNTRARSRSPPEDFWYMDEDGDTFM